MILLQGEMAAGKFIIDVVQAIVFGVLALVMLVFILKTTGRLINKRAKKKK